MAQAAYNLCIVTSKDRMSEAVTWCRKASDLRPQEPRYAYTLAFYQLQKGDEKDAVKTLGVLIEKQPTFADSYLLLGGTYEKQGKKEEAEKIYKKALETDGIPDQYKRRIAAQLEALKQVKK
jgi:predicted Zn-dependent protease